MIWWIWTAFIPSIVHVYDVNEAWAYWGVEEVEWLGECAWTCMNDNAGIGLR